MRCGFDPESPDDGSVDSDGDGVDNLTEYLRGTDPWSAPEPSGRLSNISTRGNVRQGDEVLIGGLVIGGVVDKRVYIRARGPSLEGLVSGSLGDPTIDLFGEDGLIEQNDDWETHARMAEMPAELLPASDKEAAMLVDLAPGDYTAHVSGVNGPEGVGIVEIFEVADTGEAKLLNISTRGYVGEDDGVLIGGVVISGNKSKRLTFRGRGPSMAGAVRKELADKLLADPLLQLFDASGNLIAQNNNWQDESEGDRPPCHLRPEDPFEAALTLTLKPGDYTVIVRGLKADGTEGETGIGIVEVFDVAGTTGYDWPSELCLARGGG